MLPPLVERTYDSMATLTEPHKLTASLHAVVSVARSLVLMRAVQSTNIVTQQFCAGTSWWRQTRGRSDSCATVAIGHGARDRPE